MKRNWRKISRTINIADRDSPELVRFCRALYCRGCNAVLIMACESLNHTFFRISNYDFIRNHGLRKMLLTTDSKAQPGFKVGIINEIVLSEFALYFIIAIFDDNNFNSKPCFSISLAYYPTKLSSMTAGLR